ncbi:response regulator [bacterium]|jgi:DNA-binding NarL/FixJ family response regulator|nr:response regulator [bacterium]
MDTEKLSIIKEKSRNKSILIVEDEVEMLEELKDIFSIFFKNVDIAKNGKEGLLKFQERKYDIVLTDITMPEMDGIEMISNIFKIKPSQKIIVLSAHDESNKLIPLINLGIEKFILKPLEQDKLMQKILEVLNDLDQEIELENNRKDILELNEFLSRQNDKLIRLTTILEDIIFNDKINIANDLLPRKIFKDIYFAMEKTKFRNLIINVKIVRNMQENFKRIFKETFETQKISNVLIETILEATSKEKDAEHKIRSSKGYKIITQELKSYSDNVISNDLELKRLETEIEDKIKKISEILEEISLDY